METGGGGWTYLLNRFDGSQDFDLPFINYKNGFGNLLGEFWIGLDNIHYLTGYEVNEVRFEFLDFAGTKSYALYNTFSISGKDEGYYLKMLGKYTGDAGNQLNCCVGLKFTTKDKYEDEKLSPDNCLFPKRGGWWTDFCSAIVLTGNYWGTGMKWNFLNPIHCKQGRMMVRPRDHTNPEKLPHL